MFVAKAESKLFIINELIGTINYVWISLLGYKLGGLTGIGIAFAINYFIYFWQVFLVARYRYEFRLSGDYIKTFLIQLLLVSFCLASIMLFSGFVKYAVSSVFALLSIYFALRGLDHRVGLKHLYRVNFTNKHSNQHGKRTIGDDIGCDLEFVEDNSCHT